MLLDGFGFGIQPATPTTTSDPIVEETDYTYNLQGRMDSATVDLDNDGIIDRYSEFEYDDSGIRVAKTEKVDANDDGDFVDAGDTTTRTDYHVDKNNHTGYAQVLEEMQGDVVQKSWTIGHDVFLEAVLAGQLRHLLKDGHGSTRQLVDATGAVINSGTAQVFAYDAYGVPIGFALADALTALLYSGEMTDQLTGFQYLRARYYNPGTGSFNRLDPFAGNLSDPQSLHKYLYCHADPVNGIDPSGLMTLIGAIGAMTIGMSVASMVVPAIGAAYLAIRGDISPMRLVWHLLNPLTWVSSAALVLGVGSITSAAMQQVVMKMGRQFAKKAIPVAGLAFAAYGLYESLKMTYKMLKLKSQRC